MSHVPPFAICSSSVPQLPRPEDEDVQNRMTVLPVASHIVARRLVDEKAVNIIGVEAGKRLVHRIRLIIKARSQLRFQENFLARKTRLLHRAVDRLFIHIGVAVSIRQ